MTGFATFDLIRLAAMLAAGTLLLAADGGSATDGTIEVPAGLNPDSC
jgi:hypothetical protein